MNIPGSDPRRPEFVPYLLPADRKVLASFGTLPVAAIAATWGMNPRLREAARDSRGTVETLLVDPVTARFQFEGYMSMPETRALPYSPGEGPLGTLWEPDRFDDRSARESLIESVFDVQRDLGADVLLAPYHLVPDLGGTSWLSVSVETAARALESDRGRPVGVVVALHLPALMEPDGPEVVADAYRDLPAELFWVTIVDYDEIEAAPSEVAAVMDLIDRLGAGERPVILGFTGRSGLLATARGAAGYSAGLRGPELLSRRDLREGLGSSPTHTYYLQDLMIHLPVRLADAALKVEAGWEEHPCPCPACGEPERVARLVSRRLDRHALHQRRREIQWLAEVEPDRRLATFRRRLDVVLDRCRRVREGLRRAGDHHDLHPDRFHYLEVLREVAGGRPASKPGADLPAI